MNGRRALWLVTVREIRERSRSRAFRVSSLLTVALMLLLVFLPTLFEGRVDTYRIGSVGPGNDELLAGVETILGIEDGGDTVEEIPFPDETTARAAISSGEVEAVLVGGSRLIVERAGGIGGSRVVSLLQESAASLRVEALLADPESAEVLEILSSDSLEVEALSGEEEGEADARATVAYAGLILMYVAVLTYGTWTLTGVTEEKSSRVVEVLLATLRPRHLLAGKVLGIGLLGLGQFVVTVTIAVVGIQLTGALDLPELPLESVAMLVVWFVLGYAIYSLGFGAAGALATRMEDAQSTAAPFTILAVGGFFASFAALEKPDGALAVVTTYLPPTAPFVAPLRFALGALPWWEVLLSIVVALAGIVGLVRLGGRIYAGGLLRTGAKVGWREALRSRDL